MAVLKSSIVELEASLAREKEFNTSNHRINTEYLANVLKSFLLTENKSERARLAIAITQMMHMQPDECKLIADKWAPQLIAQPGLVGWLLSPGKLPPHRSSSGGNSGQSLVSDARITSKEGSVTPTKLSNSATVFNDLDIPRGDDYMNHHR
jgi:hypothetical protein